MSLFRKPKKPNYLRVLNSLSDEDDDVEKMVVQEMPSKASTKSDKKPKFKKIKSDDCKPITKSLLSFADDEDEDEMFQVKKSSHSKKVMRQMDKERRKKAKGGKTIDHDSKLSINTNGSGNSNNCSTTSSESKNKSTSTPSNISKVDKSDNVQTEIRTDDFVLVVKNSEPDNPILNGRAAICAGRNDVSDEDDNDSDNCKHRFSKPDGLKQLLESGSIPDAAMIHAARKKRQKAREQDFIAIEEKEPIKKGNRLIREDPECDGSEEEERVDMNAITGVKEREERREQFYSVENDYSDDDSDQEMNEWENQQIRKGVTGAQLVTAQQESVLSRFMIKSSLNQHEEAAQHPSTSTLLEKAYAQSFFEETKLTLTAQKQFECNKPSFLRTPLEINELLKSRLNKLKETNEKHFSEIDQITIKLKSLEVDDRDGEQNASMAAAKYRFYQEIRGFVADLIECFDEKAPQIKDLEKRTLNILTKRSNQLIERRRQDVRDQVKEVAEASKAGYLKRGQEYDEQIRRTAEREGRRTRRRCEREKNYTLSSHLDGMSSDDEIADREQTQYAENIDLIEKAANELFVDTCEDYCNIELILSKFETWKKYDIESYRNAFVSLCLPKVLGLLIRVQMMTWNPLDEKNYMEIEKYSWYSTTMLYGWNKMETEESLANDSDLLLVPTIIDKIVVPKLTEIIENCWDPLSTTQNLRLIGLINRLGRDYPLSESSKHMRTMFSSILDKMKCSLENDVFIPIFPKQVQEAKTSFFQRQICSSLKLFRNFLSWQGIIADQPLREFALSSLLNRYLLLAMRVCNSYDALNKANVVVNTLPTVWLHPGSEAIKNLDLFITFIKSILGSLDPNSPLQIDSYDKAKKILQRLHSS